MKLETLAILGLIAGCGSFGCSSDGDVDIGDGRTGQKLTDYAGTWEGYAEAHQFPDGSDKLRIVLDAKGEGVLLVGDAPPPTTTDADHPPHVATVGGAEELVPGFSYTVKRSNVEDSRLRFQVQRSQVYVDWCALQTPYLDTVNTKEESYACVPNEATAFSGKDQCWLLPEGSPKQAIDCGKLDLCQQSWACSCDSHGCATPEAPPEIPARFALLDAALANAGEDLTGTLLVNPDVAPGLTVRLKRQ